MRSNVMYFFMWLVYLNPASGQESFLIKAVIDCLEDASHIFCEAFDCNLSDRTCGFAFCNFHRVSKCDEVFFCHVVILFVFVVIVKLFSQVFRDLGRGRNLQIARVEQAHFTMMMSVGLIAFVTDDAVDCCAAHPELAFLWCVFFHVFNLSGWCEKSRDYFYFLTIFFCHTQGSTLWNLTS